MLHGVLSSAMVLVGNFQGLILFSGVLAWSWYLVCPLFQIRYVDVGDHFRSYCVEETRAHIGEVNIQKVSIDSRPYRIFGVEPVIFCCSALFLLGRGAFVASWQAISVAIFMFTGIVLYYCSQ